MNDITRCHIESDIPEIDRAFRIARGDIAGNIRPYASGLLSAPAYCILAGLDYDRPWTRDTALNVWNCLAIIDPEIAKNTLLSCLENSDSGLRIGGQYWDAMIWAVGADAYLLATEDRDFEITAVEAITNSLWFFEETELDHSYGLFRGPAVYGDGVAAYPDRYAQTGGSSSILEWPRHNPDSRSTAGYGIPMMALSTNCVYLKAYEIATRRAIRLDTEKATVKRLSEGAAGLRKAIAKGFVDESNSRLRYLVDDFGGCDAQEGIGISLAALFDSVDPDLSTASLAAARVEPAGIPCVFPSFPRYRDAAGSHYGRHSGTVWPHVQALYADACAQAGLRDRWEHELAMLTQHAIRDGQFVEIYHPESGLSYGGRQERDGDPHSQWQSCQRQTWSATGYIRMLLRCVLGLELTPREVIVRPRLPRKMSYLRCGGLVVDGARMTIEIEGRSGTDGPQSRFDRCERGETLRVSW